MPQELRKLRIDSVASVDRGAGEGVKIMLMKRDTSTQAALEDLIAKAMELPAGTARAEISKKLELDAAPAVSAEVFKGVDEAEAYLKRDISNEKRQELAASGKAMPGGGYPIENEGDLRNAIRAYGRSTAGERSAVKAHIMRRARSLGRADLIPDKWKTKAAKALSPISKILAWAGVKKDAVDFDEAQANAEASEYADGFMCEINEAVSCLQQAICSIMCDPDCADKQHAIDESFQQFQQHVQGIVPEGIENAMAAAGLVAAGFSLTPGGALTAKGLTSMTTETITKADHDKALELEKGKTKTADDEAKAAKKRFEAVLKMSGAHKDYMNHPDNDMSDDAKGKFADMEPAERDAFMAKNPIKDKAAKRLAELPEDVRKQLAAGADAQERVTKLENDQLLKDFTKRAADLGQGEDFAKALIAIHKVAPAQVPLVEGVIKALVAQVKEAGLFKELGGQGGDATSGKALMEKRIADILKADPKLTREQAMTKVAESRTPEDQALFKRYRSETEGPNAAAA